MGMTGSDPIYAAIEAMRTADREYDSALLAGEALEDEPEEAPVRVAHEARLDAAGAAWCQARDQLVTTTPTTLAGLLAVAMFIRDYPAEALLVDEPLHDPCEGNRAIRAGRLTAPSGPSNVVETPRRA